uniref:Uncharacterized protein n=1 Tax=Avena sativa TaxID=4498 RepID=A0ACD5YE35_AVESA
MELRSGRRLSSQSMRGAPRLPRPRHCPDSGGEDGISALPDDILLQILVRLRSARAAALTSSLSRRWLGLWKHLFELSFREIPLDAIDAALQQVACPALSRLEIQIPIEHRINDAARVSALLQAAAQFAPADLIVDVWGDCKDREIPIEIPCFQRATSIKLSIANLYLTLPAGRVEFPVLEKLCLARCRLDDMNMVELTSRRCPHLRVLEVGQCSGLDKVKIHSPTIEELVLDVWLTSIDIGAPVLKQFRLKAILGSTHFSVLFSAPMVEDLSWSCSFHHHNIGISEIWCVRSLDIRTEESAYVLALQIAFTHEDFFLDGDMFQRIGPLPEFSVLEVHLGSYGHVFGAIMLDLLGTCSTIRRLMVNMQSSPRTQACPPDCLCDESPNWRSQTIPLMSLQEIKIKGFNGTDHEVDFLKLLFRCATLMKRMTVRISSKLFPGDIGYKEMRNIFEVNPSVQCSVYRRSESY